MRILVLCTGNAARSQMAEGLLRSLDKELAVESAGTDPADRVHWAAVSVMREAGIDISAQRPKSVAQFVGQDFDYVITVCDHAKETCPMFSGTVRHRLHLPFEDPSFTPGTEDDVLEAFRATRDEMRETLARFCEEHFGCRG